MTSRITGVFGQLTVVLALVKSMSIRMCVTASCGTAVVCCVARVGAAVGVRSGCQANGQQ